MGSFNRTVLALVCVSFMPGCGPKTPPVPPMSAVDARREALATEHQTRISESHHVVFRWSAQEPEFRGSGHGVARIEPPYRARLDLFLDNGEAVAMAAIVGDDLRLPDGIAEGLIPPPPLLWASLGVFRPGDRASFVEGRGAGDQLQVTYEDPTGLGLRFSIVGRRVSEAALLSGTDAVQTLEVAPPDAQGAYPSKFTYRHIPDFRELKVELESVEVVGPFPPDIWLGPSR